MAPIQEMMLWSLALLVAAPQQWYERARSEVIQGSSSRGTGGRAQRREGEGRETSKGRNKEGRKRTYQSLQPTSNTLNPIPNRSSNMFTNLDSIRPQFDVIVD